MITLLLAAAFLSPTFGAAPDPILYEIRESYDQVAAEIALSDVWLEPVHNSTKWLSLTSAQVEPCLPLSEDTQDGPYFK